MHWDVFIRLAYFCPLPWWPSWPDIMQVQARLFTSLTAIRGTLVSRFANYVHECYCCWFSSGDVYAKPVGGGATPQGAVRRVQPVGTPRYELL